MFLRKINGEELSVVKKEIIDILKSIPYDYYDWNDDSKGESYCCISVDTDEKGFVMYLYGLADREENWHINWIDNNLNCVVDIEETWNCEEIILEILYRYMQIHPETIYYDEMNWYYTKDNIDKVYASDNHIFWKYRTMKSDKELQQGE